MDNLQHRVIPFSTRAANDDGSEFDGYGSAFHTIDSYGTMFAADAFNDSLESFRESGFVGGLNHDWDNPIGKPLEARIDPKGLFLRAIISATSKGLDARILIKDGVVKKLSIGFRILGRTWFDNADDVKEYWSSVGYSPTAEDLARCEYGACLITRAQLIEVSPVTLPSNSLCDITNVRADLVPDATSLDDHVLNVLVANKTLLQRLDDVADKRAAQGRHLSKQRLAQIEEIRTQTNRLFESLVVITPDDENETRDAANAAHARFLEISFLSDDNI